MGVVRSGTHAHEDVQGRKRWLDFQQWDAVHFQDDFLGDELEAGWTSQADPGCTAAAINVQSGGVVRLATDATTSDRVDLAHELNWYPNKVIHFECRLKIDVITNVHVVAGLTDAKGEATQLLPVSLSGTTWTTTASDFIGFNFDTAATTDTWRGMGVAADTDKTSVDTSEAWAAATWIKLKMEIQVDGTATFFVNDVAKGFIAAPASTIATALCPYVGVQNRTTAIRLLDIDYFWLAQGRT